MDEAWHLQCLKKENMKQDHAAALRVLSGLRLQKVGRAADICVCISGTCKL